MMKFRTKPLNKTFNCAHRRNIINTHIRKTDDDFWGKPSLSFQAANTRGKKGGFGTTKNVNVKITHTRLCEAQFLA